MRLLASNQELFGISGVMFLYHLAHAALPSIFVLYAGFRFGWGPWEVGLVLALVGISSAIVQGALIRPAMKRFGARNTLLIGLATGSIGFIIQGIATNPILYCIGIPIFTLWGFIGPAGQQLMTARVGPDEQGQLQGASTSLMAFANLTAPIVFSQIFAFAIASPWSSGLAGAPFILAGLLLLLGVMLTVRVMPKAV
jgi:DHA1 family tetracycline resistance protein-like MFS transporter